MYPGYNPVPINHQQTGDEAQKERYMIVMGVLLGEENSIHANDLIFV